MEVTPESVGTHRPCSDPLSELLAASDRVPVWWRERSAKEGFIALRGRLSFTQAELAVKSGVAQARISHLEGGGDALLSTWRRVYAAMGFELLLFPVSALDASGLEARAEAGRRPDHWCFQRARPRPHRRRWEKDPGK